MVNFIAILKPGKKEKLGKYTIALKYTCKVYQIIKIVLLVILYGELSDRSQNR